MQYSSIPDPPQWFPGKISAPIALSIKLTGDERPGYDGRPVSVATRIAKHPRVSAVVPAKDFKRRMVVEIDGAPHIIEHIQVQTPSARGAATLYKVRARNLKTRGRLEKTFKGADSLTESSFERRPIQFLYKDGDGSHFMDSADFNQFSLSTEELEDQAPYMTENMEGVESLVVNDQVIGIEIPDTVDLPITDTAPGVKGNSATGRTKPATLSTGVIVQVPEHMEPGTMVRVDTRTGEYLGRAN